MAKTREFDYELPRELVAQRPVVRRGQCRLLVLHRESGETQHRRFYHILDYLRPGDLLILNNTKVIPALLEARRQTGGRVEILLIKETEPEYPKPTCPDRPGSPSKAGLPGFCLTGSQARWEVLAKSRGRLREGEVVSVAEGEIKVTLLKRVKNGRWLAALSAPTGRPHGPAELPLKEVIEKFGRAPLPPYIKRKTRDRDLEKLDRRRYQTVFAKTPGAVACPTAGLHFAHTLLKKIEAAGTKIAYLTLHTGPGTFQPIRTEEIEGHRMEPEYYSLPEETARAVEATMARGGRIFAVGSTSVRVLEVMARKRRWEESQGWTDLYIYPSFKFKAVDAMITNFHLPKSTLLLLVSAFAGQEQILACYEEAKNEGYRFYSYGDAMLIL